VVALLDMQGMIPARDKDCNGGNGGGVESGLSVTLCFSVVSLTLCL
jgi:hypothetical protein